MVASGILLFLFLLLSKYEDRLIVKNLDFAATVKIQERIDGSSHLRVASFVGNLMEGATFFASPELTVAVTVLLTGVMLYERRKKRWNIWALTVPLALTILVCAEIYGKTVVHHPAPPFNMIKHPTTIFPANYINEQFSYPSGHAARAIFLSVVAMSVLSYSWWFTRRTVCFVGVIGIIYISLVSVSRIYLGHHWLSDVAGGLLLGAACALIAVAVITRSVRK